MKCSKISSFNSAGFLAPGETLNYFVSPQIQYDMNCVKFFTRPIILDEVADLNLMYEILPKPENYYDPPIKPHLSLHDDKLMYNIDINNIVSHNYNDITDTLTFTYCVYDPNNLKYTASMPFVTAYNKSIFANATQIKIESTHNVSIDSVIKIKTAGISLILSSNTNGVLFQVEITETTYVNKEYKKIKHNIINETILKKSDFASDFTQSHQYINYDLTSNSITILHEQQTDSGSIISDITFNISSLYVLKFSTFNIFSSFEFNDLDNFDDFKYTVQYEGKEYPVLNEDVEPIDIKVAFPLKELLYNDNATNYIISSGIYSKNDSDVQFDAYMPMDKYFIEWKDDSNNIMTSDRMKQGSLQHMFDQFTKKFPIDYDNDMHYVYEKVTSLVIDKVAFANNVDQNISHEYLIDELNAEYISSTNISNDDILISISNRSVNYDDEMIEHCLLQKVRMTNLGSKFLIQTMQTIESSSIIGINLFLYGNTDTIHNGMYVIDWDGQHNGEGLYPGLYISTKDLKIFKPNVTNDGDISFQILTDKLINHVNVQDNTTLNISGYELIVDFNGTIGALARVFYKDNQTINLNEAISLGFTIKIR